MSTKLSTITTQYRRFTKNQVLTEGNLNEVADFFDDQDRLSRLYLQGVGIVCGFNVTLNLIPKATTNITITQGTGITTDGDLFKLYQTNLLGGKTIDLDSMVFTHCKVYDNTKAAYKPYFYDNYKKQLPLFELLTADQLKKEKDPYFSLEQFNAKTKFKLEDAVVLLYLESYEKDLDLCVSLSCDNQGLEIIGNYKVLIVSKTVAAQINSYDTIINQINYTNLYYQLPNVKSNRIVLKYSDFINFYKIKETFIQGILKNNVVGRLTNGYTTLLTTLQMPTFLKSIQSNLEELFSFEKANTPSDFQYRYDLLNDLVDTYNEIKLLLPSINTGICSPNINAFPKHLMLGELFKTGPCFEYRHAFYKSPLLTGQNLCTCHDCIPKDAIIITDGKIKQTEIAENIVDSQEKEIKICYGDNTDPQRLYSLIKRAAQLLENYNPNFNEIKITPSLQMGKLGKKAIPFYNNVGNCIIQAWDFDKTVLGNQRDNTSYHDVLLNTKNPLEIHFDNDFYRIEGHQGRNYKEAIKEIQNIRQQNGLGFNVVVLAVNATELDTMKQKFTQYYLQKNHGYEHKAGVPPGGTFIMIYVEEELPYYYSNINGPSLTGDFENSITKETVPVINPIVADFTLPYLCCDDNNVSLSLPVDKICFDDKTPPLPFKISPTGGFVKANVKPGQNGGVTINELGVTVFDPKLVSKALIGTVITFTVNNLDTKCQITAFNKPNSNFTYTISTPGITQTEVTFAITNATSANLYTWDFGDGSDIVTSELNIIKHTYTYNSQSIKKFIFNVKLFANNGNCNAETINPVSFEIVNPTLSINTTTICRNDEKEHIINIIPNMEGITLSGEGITKNKTGQYVFIAANTTAGVNTVNVLVNGKPSNLTITLLNVPFASFTISMDPTGNLIISNNSQNAQSYTWTINKEIIITDKKDSIIRPVSSFSNAKTVSISLTASGLCGKSIDGPREIPIVIPQEGNPCFTNANTFINSSIDDIGTLKKAAADKKFKDITTSFISETDNRFKEIQKNTLDYVSGNLNENLQKIFPIEPIMAISGTVKTITGVKVPNTDEVTAVQSLITMNTQLFYTTLKCQQSENISKSINQIVPVTNSFTRLLQTLADIKFNTDNSDILKNFLENELKTFEGIDFMTTQIKNQIQSLIDASKF